MRFPQWAVVGMIFVAQYFTNSGIRIFAGMITQRAIIAYLRPQFFKHRNFFFIRMNTGSDVLIPYGFHFLTRLS
jgi:hypothetical protein